jgi:hypothetical protein
MKPRLPAPPSTVDEAEWINAELVRRLMHTAYGTRLWGALPIPLMVGVLWGHVSGLALALWTLLAVAVGVARFSILRHYRSNVLRRDSA